MSDERSRQGYDDVLSSVRRIVASEAEAAAEAETGKLLLTPALRVAEPADPEAAPDHAPVAGSAPGGQPADQPPGDRPGQGGAAADDSPEADGSTADDPEGERFFPTLEERIAELEASVGNDPVDWEPDGSEDQAQHAPNGVVLPLNAGARRNIGQHDRASQTNEADIVFAVPGDAPGEAETGHEEVAGPGPETVTPDTVTPDTDIPDTDIPGTGEQPDRPAMVLPPMATFRHRGQPDDDASPGAADDDETALLDEGALRELVAEIVREELQGGLGERITRNVRKLVRAEIQRAFAARDLD